jgi:hypothetical protein
MSYIGNEPFSVAFLTDTFSGNGSTTAFTLSAAPAGTSSILVAITGVVQDPSTYSVVGTTLTFSPAPPTGTGNISVRFLGIPASGVTTTAYRTVTEFTATAGQTTFSVPSYTPGFIDVYRNGVMLGSADYTASNGVSVVLASGATAGDLVEVISFSVSSVLNAIPSTAGSVSTANIANGSVTPAKLSTGYPNWDTSGNLGVGTSSLTQVLNLYSSLASGSGVGTAIKITSDGSGGDNGYIGVNKGTGNGLTFGCENRNIIFQTGNTLPFNGTERMRISSNGQVLINSTTDRASGRFEVSGNSDGTFNPMTVVQEAAGSTSRTSIAFYRVSASANVGVITTTNSSTSYVTSSDYRLKENIAPMTGALAVVGQLKPCTYTWKIDGSDGQGFIAHELAEVVPDAVTGEKDAVETYTDEDGNEQTRIKAQGIDTSFLVATLTAAIQELKAEVDSLKAEVTALKGAE